MKLREGGKKAMSEQVKYVEVKKDWWGRIKEKDLVNVIRANQIEGWV